MLPRCLTTLFRPFASAASARLVKSIEKEIEFEHSQYKVDESVAPFLQESGFDIEDLEGSSLVTLRKVAMKFDVEVTFAARAPVAKEETEETQEEAQGENQEFGAPENYAEFQVTVKSQGSREALIFECNSVDSELSVNNIVHTQNLQNTERTSNFNNREEYRGPDFGTLDEKLQNAFIEFLKAVGVNEDLAIFVENYSLDKEQRLYMEWLQRMNSFVR